MSKFRRKLMMGAKPKYILFEDPEIEKICVQNFSSDGIGVTKKDAERGWIISNKIGFNSNKNIHKFNEFELFINISFTPGNSGNYMFANSTLEEISFPPNMKNVNPETFHGCKSLNVFNGINIENIYIKAFRGTALVSVNFPFLTYIGQQCFESCKELKNIIDLGVIKETAANAFAYCTNLTDVNLPPTLEIIKNGTFYQCSKLSILDLPDKVKSIEEFAFGGTRLSTLISRNPIPPSFSSRGQGGINIIYVPDSSVEAYKIASGWSNYASKIKPLSEYVPQ